MTNTRALVIFLDAEEAPERHAVDLNRVSRKKSSVDRWIGVIEGAELGDWKAERRKALEYVWHLFVNNSDLTPSL